MRVLVALSAIPYSDGEAIDVVSYAVVKHLASSKHEIVVQAIIREGRTAVQDEREVALRQTLSEFVNVKILPSIYIGDYYTAPSRLENLLGYAMALLRGLPLLRSVINPFFFPALAVRNVFHKRVKDSSPDVIASIWSWEALALSFDIDDIPKYVYYGNPNHKPLESQLDAADLFGMSSTSAFGKFKIKLYRYINRSREAQHLRMMKRCEMTTNNSLVDAAYYTENGHPNSSYLQNMWPPATSSLARILAPKSGKTVRLAASVGNLAATGNTFGLHYLGQHLIPALRQVTTLQFIMDIYGGGSARPEVAKVLQHDEIRLRGWVDDIDQELVNSDAFLILTNAEGFIVGNTRLLLAWSLGVCVIAHTNSSLAMPEVKHMENTLLGETAEEIADLIKLVSREPELARKIGRGGLATFEKHYTVDSVMPRMLDQIESCVLGNKSLKDL